MRGLRPGLLSAGLASPAGAALGAETITEAVTVTGSGGVGLAEALAALALALAGWFSKHGVDTVRRRRNGQGPPAPGVAPAAFKEHEQLCKERDRLLHERITNVREVVAKVAADVSYLRGRLEGQDR